MSDLNSVEIDVVLQKPIPVTIIAEDGTRETINLPRLGIDGLIPWLTELTEVRRENFRKAIAAAKLDKRQQLDAEFSLQNNLTAVIGDLTTPIQTPVGMRKVIALSLAMTDLPADKQAFALKTIMGKGLAAIDLASRLSTLFASNEQRPPATEADAGAEIEAKAQAAFPGAKIASKAGEAGPLDGEATGQPTADPAPDTTGSPSA